MGEWNERGYEFTDSSGKFWRWHPINGTGCNCGVAGCYYSNEDDRRSELARWQADMREAFLPASRPWWARLMGLQ